MNQEDALIDWLRRQQQGGDLDRPGDDAAIIGRGAQSLAMTVDQQIAGVHVPEDLAPSIWARRLLAVNLSDLAAMGARPVAALLTLAVPETFPLRPFLRAAVTACQAHGLPLAGGDIARSPTATTTMTLIGRRPAGGRWLRRDAARPGDRLWIGGPVGLSALGQRWVARGARLVGRRVTLPPDDRNRRVATAARRAVRRHLAPDPQLALGQWLGQRRRAAAIDISDGLSRDLARMCRASGVGGVIELDALPLPAEMRRLAAAEGVDPVSLALGGGEDYVLLFSLGPRTTPPPRWNAVPIGRCIQGHGLWSERDGQRTPIQPTGWDHLA